MTHVLTAVSCLHLNLVTSLGQSQCVALQGIILLLMEFDQHMERLISIDSEIGSLSICVLRLNMVWVQGALTSPVAVIINSIRIWCIASMSCCVPRVFICLHEVKLWT